MVWSLLRDAVARLFSFVVEAHLIFLFGRSVFFFRFFQMLCMAPTNAIPGTYTYTRLVAPVAYQVILKPGIGQFRELESLRVHTRINWWGLFLVHKLTCGKRGSVS